MASTLTSLINHNFGGIRRKDSMFSDEKITCSDCQNIELFYTDLNSAVGIKTAKGNIAINNLIPEGEEVIGIFETILDTITYFMVYTESTTQGKLYVLDTTQNILEELINGLSVTGKAQGTTLQQGITLDVFAFSNGVDIKFVYSDIVNHVPLLIPGVNDQGQAEAYKLTVNLTDNENRTVKGLGLVNLFGRLWVFDGRVLWGSIQNSVANFHNSSEDTSEVTRAFFNEYSKNITAIHEYLGSLAVFHKDSSSLLTQDSNTLFKASDESPGGCASYDALVFHGTDLFFYDDTKKGVFSFQQVINGDKTLGENIAYDIQEELLKISSLNLDKIRALSVVTSDRNEVWFLLPITTAYKKVVNNTEVEKRASIVLIYDYIRGEWVKRKCQHINAIGIIENVLYSGGEQIYAEYTTSDFNGDYIENYYKCTIMNLGSDNTLKITKFPPRLTIDATYQNNFFCKYVKNYNEAKSPKVKKLSSKSFSNTLRFDFDYLDSGKTFKPTSINGIIKMPSATFKALEITFFTNDKDQDFTIKAFEFSKIKVKQI